MGENGFKFSFDRICVVSMAPGGARVSIWAGLGGWLVEEWGSPEQDSKLLTPKPSRTGASFCKNLESSGPHARPERPPPSSSQTLGALLEF